MASLNCDRAEAEEVYNYDYAIDHGEATPHDLPQEKLKVAQKYAHTGTRKTSPGYKFTKRERKPNATKGGIISELASFLTENSSFEVINLDITNKERQIAFQIGENKFELTLVQKRAPKK